MVFTGPLGEGRLVRTPLFVANLIIDGRSVTAPDGMTYERRDMLTGSIVTRAAASGADVATRAADSAAAAFPKWSHMAPEVRSKVLYRTAEILNKRASKIRPIVSQEVGSSSEWHDFNIRIAREILYQAATLCDAVGEETVKQRSDGVTNRLVRRPAGVVLGIAPWNAAVALAVRAVAAPLALGNTVVLKSSELCPKTHECIAESFNDAGLPEGALNFITNAPEDAHTVVEALIAHPAVRRVNFTGSTRVGRQVAVTAAHHLKPCLLELSGKASMVILDDADLRNAARAAAHGAFFNQGQICMSTDRIIVDSRVADDFIAEFRTAAETLRSPNLGVKQGPLGDIISADAVLRIKGLVEDALRKGALLVTGGEMFNTAMQPTILDRVSFGMRIYEEEVFGPVASIIRVADAEEALSVANDTEYGLAASVFGTNVERARAIAKQIETGIVHINGSSVFDDPEMPFGGVKASGYGRFGGHASVQEFTELQWLTERPNPPEQICGVS